MPSDQEDISPLGETVEESHDRSPSVEQPAAVRRQGRLMSWVSSRFDRPAAQGLVFAGFWYRAIAFMIDFPLSLIFALSVLIGPQLFLPPHLLGPLNTVGGNTASMLLIQMLYFIGFERSAWKSTPGKRLFKLRVTDKRGMRLGWGKAILRSVAKLSIPFTFGAVIVPIFFSNKSQTLYDRLTLTLVLRKTNESFLPKATPAIIQRHHWWLVIAMTLVLSVFAIRGTVMVMKPRVDIMTLQLMVQESLKDMAKTQLVIEEAMKKEGKPPAKIDASSLSRNLGKQYNYVPSNGTITLMFGQGPLSGRGLVLSPTMEANSKEVVWSCAAINLPKELAPNNCAATDNNAVAPSARR
jgi:uncharacterized RDD family membrane protein YckC